MEFFGLFPLENPFWFFMESSAIGVKYENSLTKNHFAQQRMLYLDRVLLWNYRVPIAVVDQIFGCVFLNMSFKM